MPLRLNASAPDFEDGFRRLLAAKRETDEDVGRTVAEILAAVKARGDAALIDYSARFDRIKLTPAELRIGEQELREASQACPPEALEALDFAAARIDLSTPSVPRISFAISLSGLLDMNEAAR